MNAAAVGFAACVAFLFAAAEIVVLEAAAPVEVERFSYPTPASLGARFSSFCLQRCRSARRTVLERVEMIGESGIQRKHKHEGGDEFSYEQGRAASKAGMMGPKAYRKWTHLGILAGVRLDKLSAVTIDDIGKETFIMGGALDPFKSETHNLKRETVSQQYTMGLGDRPGKFFSALRYVQLKGI
ncbi:vacuolar protein sorting-associated protein 13A-like [Senna tora]|uniref:Vacuolar protein sorting-associated protein 13A-like n=1 Tax=Senna tora TaxID=362788 RepID=A0A834WNT5_9FABA|nr:vacuolar protein sorting-associated protein 13A-like [Senna tora]